MTASFKVTSREITTSWTVTRGDWPDIVVRATTLACIVLSARVE